MNIKKLIAITLVILTFSFFAMVFAYYNIRPVTLDSVEVNDITQSLSKHWHEIKSIDLPGEKYKLDYVVLDNNGELIRATRTGLNEDINSAIINRDTIIDIMQADKPLGKLIIYNNTNEQYTKYKNRLHIISVSAMLLLAFLCIIYSVYINWYVFHPFRKLQSFARQVAAGNLHIPLEMDKGNKFGAFTESFDLMREELAKARESERKANQSKRELVASLSHDIKTPVASIKAVSEVMSVKTGDAEILRQLEIINTKADQIDFLITNMFNATLEELEELSVINTELQTTELYDIIKSSDYNNKVSISKISECIVLADKLRLTQVIDNIISNSYKYADTSISVTSRIKGKTLELEFNDFGHGVSEEELPLLFNKFYRAGNAEGKSGSGLGLYISKYLMSKMSGDIDCRNTEDGFTVILYLRIF